RHASARVGLGLYRLPIGLLPDQIGELDMLARLWRRETRLLPLALYLDGDEGEGPTPTEAQRGDRFLNRSTGVTLLAGREAWPLTGCRSAVVDVARPTGRTRASLGGGARPGGRWHPVPARQPVRPEPDCCRRRAGHRCRGRRPALASLRRCDAS